MINNKIISKNNLIYFLKLIIFYPRKISKKIYNSLFKIPFIEKPLPEIPFTKKPISSKKTYINLHKITISKKYEEIEEFEEINGFNIDKKWFANLTLATQTCIKESNLNFNHGRLLYTLLSKYISNNKNLEDSQLFIFETGTARGFSSICMSKALNDMKRNGTIITVDCIPHYKKIYWNAISDFDGKISRAELLKPWSRELKNIIFIQGWSDNIINRLGINRINFAFLDAQHTKKAVLEEFNFVCKKQKSGDIIFFDDVTPDIFQGVCEALKEIDNLGLYKIKYYNFDKSRGYAVAEKI